MYGGYWLDIDRLGLGGKRLGSLGVLEQVMPFFLKKKSF